MADKYQELSFTDSKDSGKNRKTIAVCVPTYEVIPSNFFHCFIGLIMHAGHSGYRIELLLMSYADVVESRNRLSQLAKEKNPDYIFWVDTDTLFPADSIDVLMKIMEDTGAGMVGGVCFEKQTPHYPNIRMWKDNKAMRVMEWGRKGNTFKVDLIGFGMILMKGSLLDQIDQPYFERRIDREKPEEKPISEDFDFCLKVRDAGHEIWATTALDLHHGWSGPGYGLEHYDAIRKKQTGTSRDDEEIYGRSDNEIKNSDGYQRPSSDSVSESNKS